MGPTLPAFLLWILFRICGFIAAVVLIGTLSSLLAAALSPLRAIPGPFFARFSQFWYVRHVNKGKQNIDEIELHKRYGPIVRLAPKQYSFSDIGAIKTMYDHGSKFRKSDFYAPFGNPNALRSNIFQDQDIRTHAEKRRKIAPLYSMSSILTYEPFVDNCMETYITQLDHIVTEHKAINVPDWMQFYAFDVIGAISIGDPYGFMVHGYDFPGVIHEMHSSQAYGVHIGAFKGSLHKYVAAITTRVSKRAPFTATLKYTQASLEKKQHDLENGKSVKESTGKQDFAEKLLALKAEGRISDFDLRGSIQANIAAGSDTTGVSLSAIMYHLLRSPPTLAKLRKEISEHRVAQDDKRFLTFAQAQEMPYLQAIVKEALRMYPGVGMQLPRVVPEGGATLAGHFFPAGTVVGTNPWVVHRQTELFGDDADVFRPERWLEDEQKAKIMDKHLLTFGGGARTCLGKNISLLEIQKLIPELVNRYDFGFVDETKEWETLNRFFVFSKYECFVRKREEEKA